MRSKSALVLFSTVGVALAACTGAGAAPSAPTGTQVALGTLIATSVPEASTTTVPSTEPTAGGGGGGGGQATPGPIDPCSLITADEASKAIGVKLSAGVSTDLDPDRVCTFGKGTTEVKLILAPQAPDAATAKAYWDQARAEVPSGIQINDLSYFDRSAYGNGTSAGASVSALFVIDGTYFFDFYCGFPACSQDASVAAAQLIAGRLP